MQKPLSSENLAVVVQKMEHYCAYQERCSHEAEQKLRELKVPAPDRETIMKHLVDQRFIDDARYACSFARGKFGINKWGKIKIGYELRGRQIPENLVRQALDEIDDGEYLDTIRELVLKKKQEIKTGKNFTIREKIINFVAGKGFEFDRINEILKELKI